MIRVCNVWHADFALAAWDKASKARVCMCVCDSLSQYSHQTVLSATYTPDVYMYFVNVANHYYLCVIFTVGCRPCSLDFWTSPSSVLKNMNILR